MKKFIILLIFLVGCVNLPKFLLRYNYQIAIKNLPPHLKIIATNNSYILFVSDYGITNRAYYSIDGKIIRTECKISDIPWKTNYNLK